MSRRGFTLVEILIVVVILGILAAIVIPSMARATEDSQRNTTFSELQKIRRHIEMYRARNAGALPQVVDGSAGDWGQIVGLTSEYLQSPPTNAWVGGVNSRRIHFATAPDSTYQEAYGWIFNPLSGEVWAGSFDNNDSPIAR